MSTKGDHQRCTAAVGAREPPARMPSILTTRTPSATPRLLRARALRAAQAAQAAQARGHTSPRCLYAWCSNSDQIQSETSNGRSSRCWQERRRRMLDWARCDQHTHLPCIAVDTSRAICGHSSPVLFAFASVCLFHRGGIPVASRGRWRGVDVAPLTDRQPAPSPRKAE